MAHPSKAKGDSAEREAVKVLTELAPHLVMQNPRRLLGAGRREDEGDLYVIRDTTFQVRAYKNVALGLRSAAADAISQQQIADTPLAVGLVPIPRSRTVLTDGVTVRWLASAHDWPDPEVSGRSTTEHFNSRSISKALAWMTDKTSDVPRHLRCVVLERPEPDVPLIVGPIQAWLHDYEIHLPSEMSEATTSS